MISCKKEDNIAPTTQNIQPAILNIGKIIKVKGTVLRNNQVAKEGDLLSEGDTIETKERAFARMKMEDETVINLGQKSKINLKDYKLNDPDNRIVDINLIVGKVKTHFVKKLEGNKGSLKVSTKLASFGVRGTEFITENTASGKTKMLLLEGKVILTKKKKDSEEKQEIEIRPLEVVSFEEKTEEVITQTVSEEALVQTAEDEDLNIDIQQIEESLKIDIEEEKAEVTPKSSSVKGDPNIRNFLFSLEHGSKALPLKQNGKIVYFDKMAQDKLVRNKKGEVIAIDPSLDKGEKMYRVPVIFENGDKAYVAVSEEYLKSVIKQSDRLGIQVFDQNRNNEYPARMPASSDTNK
jgi:hypothetical protein